MGEPFLFAQPLYIGLGLSGHIYIARTKPNRLAFVSLETPVAEEKKKSYPHFYGGYRGGVDFSCPIITELRKICCNFAYGYSL